MAGFDYLIKSTTIVQEIIEQNAKDAKNGVKKQPKRPNSELRQNEGDGKELWKRPASAQKRAQRPGSAMVRKKPIEESESVNISVNPVVIYSSPAGSYEKGSGFSKPASANA